MVPQDLRAILTTIGEGLKEFTKPLKIHRIGSCEGFVPLGIQAGSRKAIIENMAPNKSSIHFSPSSQSSQGKPPNQTSIATRVQGANQLIGPGEAGNTLKQGGGQKSS